MATYGPNRKARMIISRAVCLIGAMCAVLSHPAQAQSYEKVFSDLERAVTENFYDPHFGGRNWPQIAERYSREVPKAKSDAEFQRLGQRMLNELGVSHVVLHLPGTNRPTMGIGARWERIESHDVVVDIDPASGARAAGLRIGDRILNPDAVRGPRQEAAMLDVERCDGSRPDWRFRGSLPTGRRARKRFRGAFSSAGTVDRSVTFVPSVSATMPPD